MAAIDAFGRFELGGGHEGGAVEAGDDFPRFAANSHAVHGVVRSQNDRKGRFNVLLQHHPSQTSPDDHASFRVDDVPSDF